MTGSELPPVVGVAAGRAAVRVLRLLRWWVAAVWLSNGLAKLFGVARVDVGWFRASLIDLDSARGILQHAVAATPIRPLAVIYAWPAGAAWPVFSVLLTVVELAIGVALLAGEFTRVAATAGLLLIGPIWVMTWPAGAYLWDYPADLVPLLLLTMLPAPRSIRASQRRRRHRLEDHSPTAAGSRS